MPVTATNLTAALSDTASTSFTTASISPGANKLILCAISSRRGDSIQPLPPSVSGCSLTWVQVISVDWDTTTVTMKTITVFRAMGSSPTTGSITFDFGTESQTNVNWIVDEFDGINTGGTNGSDAVVQAVFTNYQPANVSPIVVNFAPFSRPDNAAWGLGCDSASSQPTVGANFTQLGYTGGNLPLGRGQSKSEFYNKSIAQASFTLANITSTESNIIGVEIAVASPPPVSSAWLRI